MAKKQGKPKVGQTFLICDRTVLVESTLWYCSHALIASLQRWISMCRRSRRRGRSCCGCAARRGPSPAGTPGTRRAPGPSTAPRNSTQSCSAQALRGLVRKNEISKTIQQRLPLRSDYIFARAELFHFVLSTLLFVVMKLCLVCLFSFVKTIKKTSKTSSSSTCGEGNWCDIE